ncbi:MAG: host-nuclease inhibitor Gam family protein, partial [Lentisphaerae bacterium]|nr:host-nuclease inhibitor Gam family protein [Lentisphaerota bacterium]
DGLFCEIVEMELTAASIGADGDAEVQKIKDRYEKLLARTKFQLPEKVTELTAYILANSERFQKPRARKTPEGQYGLRSVSNLEISDESKVYAYVKGAGMNECFEIKVVLKKDAVLKALNEGHQIPGAEIVSGERAFYKVAQELLQKAKGK